MKKGSKEAQRNQLMTQVEGLSCDSGRDWQGTGDTPLCGRWQVPADVNFIGIRSTILYPEVSVYFPNIEVQSFFFFQLGRIEILR